MKMVRRVSSFITKGTVILHCSLGFKSTWMLFLRLGSCKSWERMWIAASMFWRWAIIEALMMMMMMMALRHEASVANRGFLPFPAQTGASSAALGRPNARLVPGCAFKRQSETTSRLHFQPKETKRQCNSERVSWRKLLESTGNEQIYANALQSNAMKLANIIFYRIPMQSIFEWQHAATKKNRKWLKISPGFIISISSAVCLCWSSPCSKMACAWATAPRWPLRQVATKARNGGRGSDHETAKLVLHQILGIFHHLAQIAKIDLRNDLS